MINHQWYEAVHKVLAAITLVGILMMFLFIMSGCSTSALQSTPRVPDKESGQPSKAAPKADPKDEPVLCRFFFGC